MIAVTGANGYVGGRILAHLKATGADAIALVRRPAEGDRGSRRYALAAPLDADALDGVDTVIHAAYDLSVRGERVAAVNCTGSLPLLDAVAERGGRVVLISTLAAFDGARSRYGAAKRELEHAVLSRGGVAIRPGLVFGAGARGMFGSLVGALSRGAPVPLFGGGAQRLFVTHDERLCQLVAEIARGRVEPPSTLFAAHEVPTSLREIAAQIASASRRRLLAVSVPAPPAMLALRCAEAAGVQLPFRSDSLRSLLNPAPLDQVSALARSPLQFPALSPALWLDR